MDIIRLMYIYPCSHLELYTHMCIDSFPRNTWRMNNKDKYEECTKYEDLITFSVVAIDAKL